jgi:glycosyltransferase involved in cell wall biosynthesis
MSAPAIAVIDLLAQPYDEASILHAPLGGTQSAIIETCLSLAERVEAVLYNGIGSPRKSGRLRIEPNTQITMGELGKARWIVFASWVTEAGLRQLPFRKGGPKAALWAHHDVDQEAVQFMGQRAALEYLSKYLFVSRWQRDRYLDRFRIAPERAAIIGNPYCARAMPATGLEDKRFDVPRLIYASTPFRGLGVLVDAFPMLADDLPGATLTVLSGMELYGMQDNSAYQDLFDKMKRTRGISLHKPAGKIELYRSLRDANLFAFPSTFAETFCIAALEARVLGNPLLLTDHGALREIFADAEFFDRAQYGALAPESWASFVVQRWRALRSDLSRTAALQAQMEEARRTYSPAAIASRLLDALEA